MRFARYAWLFVFLLPAVPSWGKQAPQQASPPQAASDPQALAVVQAAITALGGRVARAPRKEKAWGGPHVGVTCGAFALVVLTFLFIRQPECL
jgi:hypothetical protein